MIFDATKCKRGAPVRALWSADEAQLAKSVLNNLAVIPWDNDFCEVDRRDPGGNWVIRIPAGGPAGGVDINAYFWAVKTGANSVKVMAGATQRAGHGPVYHDEQEFDDITEDSVIFAEYHLESSDWSISPAFLKIADELPESTVSIDYRPIAYITGEGEGTEEDPYRITGIVQAHVGVLREPQLPAGNTDGEIAYWDAADGKWEVLPAPGERSVLMYDPEPVEGSPLQWVEVDTFTCEEEEEE